jgi:glycosyltransferase involved in cell wall biosynthesis
MAAVILLTINMNKKRIILIRNAKSYDFGGGERFPVFAADILQKNGYAPVIISRSSKLRSFAKGYDIPTIKGWWWSHQNWSGGSVLLFPIYVIWQLILTIWYTLIFLRLRPQAIHIQSKDDFIAATLAGRLVGARIVWTDHADLKHVWRNLTTWYKNPVGKLVYICAHFAHAISLVSQSEYTLITAHLPRRSRVTKQMQVIYNGVLDTAKYFTDTPPSELFTYCVASRLVTDKGIKEVIDAYKTIAPRIPNSQLVLLGDGPEAKIFQNLAADMPGIKFLGHQSNPLEIMAQADVFVHPTYHEGFSVALVEASMLSLPIIATSVGGNVEIIENNITGLLVRPRNTGDLAQAMLNLSTNKTLRMEISKAARQQYIDRFQFDHIVNESFVPLYERGKS